MGRLNICVDEILKQSFKKLAKDKGQSMSSLIRRYMYCELAENYFLNIYVKNKSRNFMYSAQGIGKSGNSMKIFKVLLDKERENKYT